MIDDLLRRIDAYWERVYDARSRHAEEESEYDDEYEYEHRHDHDETEEDEYAWTPPVIPDVIEFDETVSEIHGHWADSEEKMKPLRYSVSPDNPWYFDIDGVVFSRETGLLICFPPGYGSEYTVPDDERITGIGERAFAQNHLLKKIGLNSRIRYIGKCAFMECAGLQEILIPPSVEFVGLSAFEDCVGLKKAVLNCALKSIPRSCFRHASSLEVVCYSADITEIEQTAFASCGCLVDMKPAGQEDTDCDLVISASVDRIGRYAFSWCDRIRSVRLPDRTVDLGSGAFCGCSALEQINTEYVRSYGSSCFESCTSLTDFTFGRNTAHLGRYLFYFAENLMHIDFTCSSGLDCDYSALPECVDYTVDTRAWLSVKSPWLCRPLFDQCVKNIISGESVPEETVLSAVKVLKRNRRKCFDWFLSDDALLDWVLDKAILDGEDCLALLDMTKDSDPKKAEMIRSYAQRRFTARQIASAQKKRAEKEQERIEAELEKQRIREEKEREREHRKQRARELREKWLAESQSGLTEAGNDPDIKLDDMGLSVRACNCLKRQGIFTLFEAAAMTDEDLRRACAFGQVWFQDVKDRMNYYLYGDKVPEEEEDSSKLEVFTVDDLSDLVLDDL